MLYNFDAAAGRRIFECVPNIWIKPQLHPARTMEMHDIFYMIEGYWSVLLDNEEIRIKPGDIAVLPAAIAHRGLEPCKANTRTIFIHFSMEKPDHRVSTLKTGKNIPENYLTVSSLSHDNGNTFSLFQIRGVSGRRPGRRYTNTKWITNLTVLQIF
jgi:mannose-6-phosphate isomerase-like protein (cupin superfamily)